MAATRRAKRVTGTTQNCHPTVTMRRYGLSRVPQRRPDEFRTGAGQMKQIHALDGGRRRRDGRCDGLRRRARPDPDRRFVDGVPLHDRCGREARPGRPSSRRRSSNSTGTGGGIKLFCGGVGETTPDFANASRADQGRRARDLQGHRRHPGRDQDRLRRHRARQFQGRRGRRPDEGADLQGAGQERGRRRQGRCRIPM